MLTVTQGAGLVMASCIVYKCRCDWLPLDATCSALKPGLGCVPFVVVCDCCDVCWLVCGVLLIGRRTDLLRHTCADFVAGHAYLAAHWTLTPTSLVCGVAIFLTCGSRRLLLSGPVHSCKTCYTVGICCVDVMVILLRCLSASTLWWPFWPKSGHSLAAGPQLCLHHLTPQWFGLLYCSLYTLLRRTCTVLEVI